MNCIHVLAIGLCLVFWGASETVGNLSHPGKLLCKPNQVACDNHYRCVNVQDLCDGVDDCRDNSDENLLTCIKMGAKSAKSSCKDDEFLCLNRCNMCIPKRYLCDGDNDCGDSSDENPENCIKEGQYDDHITCGDIGVKCPHANGTCLSKASLCNGINDCGDNSDENITHCILMGQVADVLTCPPSQFKCKNGFKCVSKHSMCNSFNNCYDGSDEDPVECIKENILPANTTCTDLGFECSNTSYDGRFCIGNLFICDGKNDCGDSSDENPEMCHHRTDQPKYHLLPWYDPPPPNTSVERQCGNNQFRCSVGRIRVKSNENGTYLEKVQNHACIPNRYVCDLDKDCGDGIDEDPSTCQNRTIKFGCMSHQFKCPENNKCIPKSHICDGDDDCDDSADEDPNICHLKESLLVLPPTVSPKYTPRPLICKRHEFRCKNGLKCIKRKYICDGDIDCNDNSDEDPDVCDQKMV